MAGIQDPKVFAGISEKELQSTVLDIMRWQGWLCYHTFDSRRSGPGFPDLVAIKGSRLLFVEFKAEKGKIREEQIEWLDRLVQAHDDVYLVRPSTMDGFLKDVNVSGSDLSAHWRNIQVEMNLDG